jgi:predicted PurR-regulated permease PerM
VSAFSVMLVVVVVLLCAVVLAFLVTSFKQAVEGTSREVALTVFVAMVIMAIEAPLLLVLVVLFAEEINYVLTRAEKAVSEHN